MHTMSTIWVKDKHEYYSLIIANGDEDGDRSFIVH